MLVKYWMKKQFFPVNADDLMSRAVSITDEYRPTLLPVIKSGKLVGVVTDHDLKRALISNKTGPVSHEHATGLLKVKLEDIMSAPPITLHPDDTLEEAAARFMIANISGAPVLEEDGEVIGILSNLEIMMAFISLAGFGKKGLQWAMEVEDKSGSIKEITDIIRNYGGRIVSLLTSYVTVRPQHRRLYLRVWTINRDELYRLESEISEKATLLYRVDHKNGKRSEFVIQERDHAKAREYGFRGTA